MDKEQGIERAKQLRREDQLEESQELLFKLMNQFPDDAQILFEVGGSFDVLGEEIDAIPYYEDAIEAGLEGSDLQECLVCLGSSLRVVGRFDEAIAVLERAVDEFPEQNSSRAFLALAYYSQGRHEDAVQLLLALLLDTTSDDDVLAYEGALDYYKDNLNEVIGES